MLRRLPAHLATLLLASVLLAACATAPRMSYGVMPSLAMRGARMHYAVYAPRDLRPDERLPLVVLLHRGGDDVRSFDRHAVGQAFDRALASGEIPRVVVVLPEGDLGFWANWADGSRRYRDWVLDDLVPHTQSTYHTQGCPEGCQLMGVSMGGSGALAFMLHRPGFFRSVAVISAPIFDARDMQKYSDDRLMQILVPMHRIWGTPTPHGLAQQDPFQRWQTPADLQGTHLTLAYASGDRPGIPRGNRRLHRVLEARGVPHDIFVFPGHHGWESWTPVFLRVLHDELGTDHDAPASALDSN